MHDAYLPPQHLRCRRHPSTYHLHPPTLRCLYLATLLRYPSGAFCYRTREDLDGSVSPSGTCDMGQGGVNISCSRSMNSKVAQEWTEASPSPVSPHVHPVSFASSGDADLYPGRWDSLLAFHARGVTPVTKHIFDIQRRCTTSGNLLKNTNLMPFRRSLSVRLDMVTPSSLRYPYHRCQQTHGIRHVTSLE